MRKTPPQAPRSSRFAAMIVTIGTVMMLSTLGPSLVHPGDAPSAVPAGAIGQPLTGYPA